MDLPKYGDKLTQEQVDLAVNLKDFPNAKPGAKDWHDGLFEIWTKNFGYPEGMAMYASVVPNEYHIYFLNDGHKATIILKPGQTPADYGIQPK